MDVLDTYYHIFRIMSESRIINRYSKLLLRGLFAPYGVRLIENEEILDLINNNHVILHRSSSLIPDLLTFKYEKHELAKKMHEDISKKVVDEVFFADVDHEHILAPLDVVLILIKEKMF